MPWMEVKLNPKTDWNDQALDDWSCALGAFLTEKGINIKPKSQTLPGYQVLSIGDSDNIGEIILSASERVVLLEGLSLQNQADQEFAYFALRAAREMGALGLCCSANGHEEREFWQSLGGVIYPDPVPLEEEIQRVKVGVERLDKLSILVTYRGKPVLCLEPIACNAHGPGPVSLAQYRLEKMYGGRPLGFASRVAVHSPWEISKLQWDDLLAFSRIQSYEVLFQLVLEYTPEYLLV